jgi:hypothetical protein
MSSPTPTATPPRAPFQVYSVHFDFPGGQAIRLRDPVTNQLIGATPEWVVATRNELAAYVRATRPVIRVVFRATAAADGRYTVGADGTPFQVEERQITLAFNAGTGLSAPEFFQATNDLPDQIGLHPTTLNWYVRVQPAPAHCPPAGTSTHTIATSWRALGPAPVPETGLPNWVYRPLMEWTCQWAAGQNDEKAICDAIIANVRNSRLQYGVYARDVREMLLNQGGMCGVWYQAFQQMAHCQGVFVYRRRFLVDWRQVANGEEHWCAIVIRKGGLNQAVPTHPASLFRDNDTGFPIPAGTAVPIVNRNEQRYRFWGLPNNHYDGHCINFLVYNGQLYLYDACFGVGPIQINARLPVNNTNLAQGGANLAPFKVAYFDHAIDYMLGSIHNGPAFLRSIFVHPPGIALANGMTVRTTDIPLVVNGNDGLTFRWGN